MERRQPSTYLGILRLATPLVLTMSSHMLMQFMDTLFLSWYSADAVAAAVPAGMASWLVACAFFGTAGYTSTMVAHFVGANRPTRVASTVWQGVYFGIVSGALVALCGLLAEPLFRLVGHDPEVQKLEVIYFQVLCYGAPLMMTGHAVNGFFAGRHDTKKIFYAQAAGAIVNVAINWVLIFGRWGFPRMGILGAAIGVVLGQAAILLILGGFFLRPKHQRDYGTWKRRALDWPLLKRLMRYGFPNGIRFAIEVSAWTAFLFFVGRLGKLELTATNIAWRIEGFAFFPVIGVAQAVAIMVGNAQGKEDPSESMRVTRRGLAMSQIWVASVALLFVLLPRELFGLFYSPDSMTVEFFDSLVSFGTVLLRFVALYCLLDAFNIVILSALQAAGDTRWTLWAALAANAVFLGALVWADIAHWGVYAEWGIATAFVCAQALMWLGRLLSGRWKDIRVIEGF